MKSKIIQDDIKTIAEELGPDSTKLSGKTLLITGGAGFLGKYFILTIDHLNKNILQKPCRIISIDNFITGSGYPIDEGQNFKAVKHDVTKPLKIKKILII